MIVELILMVCVGSSNCVGHKATDHYASMARCEKEAAHLHKLFPGGTIYPVKLFCERTDNMPLTEIGTDENRN